MSITFQDGVAGAFQSTGNQALATSASVGDLIVACAFHNNNTGSDFSDTVSDNVNSGNYSIAYSALFGFSGGCQFVVAWKVCNASGTPTVTYTNFSQGGFISAMRWNGFTGLLTIDPSQSTGNNAFSSAVNSGNIVTAANNELVVGWSWIAGLTPPTNPAGFTTRIGSTSQQVIGFDLIASTLGTTENLNFTVANTAWWAGIFGFYGAGQIIMGQSCL
jgi:hypothetical protein